MMHGARALRALTRPLRQRVALLALLAVLVCAPGVTLNAQGLPITTYATAEGLPHVRVNRIVRDSRGFLWFCTLGGLSRFDGYSFVNFGPEQGLPHSTVNDLLETRSGEYWVATDAGLARFDPNGVPTRGVVPDSGGQRRPMFAVAAFDSTSKARVITVLAEGRSGTLWVGTDAGLYRVDLAEGRRSLRAVDIHIPQDFLEQRAIADVVEDAHGSLWVATPRGLYRRWPDGTSARYMKRDGLPGDFLGDLLEDHEGRLWAGTRHNGFFRLAFDTTHRAPRVDRKFTYPDSPGLPTFWVFQMFETSDNRFWVATSRGIAEYFPNAPEPNRFRSYAMRNGLTDFDITSLNEDLGGNLWMGTNNAGVMRLTHDGFSTFGRQYGIVSLDGIFEDAAGQLCFRGVVLGDVHTSIFEGATLDLLKGEQSAFQHNRLGCFDGKRFDWFMPGGVLSHLGWVAEGVTLRARNGDWWVATGDGLLHYAPTARFAQLKTARPIEVFAKDHGLSSTQVFRLFEDSRGNIWISTVDALTNGLARWEASSRRVRDLADAPGLPSLKENLPRSFGEDRAGNVWIGFDNALVRYAGERFAWFTARDGVPTGKVKDIHLDRSGRLWLASDGAGLVRVDSVEAERPTFVTYNTDRGLSSNNTFTVGEDVNGRLYITSGRGLDQFDPASGRVKQFTAADGLAPGIVRTAFRDHEGVLWFGSSAGLVRLGPPIERPPAVPPVYVTGLRLAGLLQPVSAIGERDMSLPDVSPAKNQLQIEFVGLGFASGDVLRYQYRLTGASAAWSAPGLERTVTYAGLGAGRYTFEVRAVNADGMVSAQPATVAFTILPPIWLRWWALTFMGISLAALPLALYRYRVARVLEMANMRTRIATDLHDDVGANLTRIALLSEVANRAQEADGPLQAITRIARESVSSMNDIVWAINPERESLLDLRRRMRQHADEVFTQRDIELHFNGPSTVETRVLGVDVRRDLLLIFKEAVNNAARHSRCTRVDIDMRMEGPRLVLRVADNGVGIGTSGQGEGHGMTSMQRRSGRLNGTLDVSSKTGAGTVVTVIVPT